MHEKLFWNPSKTTPVLDKNIYIFYKLVFINILKNRLWAQSGSLFSKSGLDVYTNTLHNEYFDMKSIEVGSGFEG